MIKNRMLLKRAAYLILFAVALILVVLSLIYYAQGGACSQFMLLNGIVEFPLGPNTITVLHVLRWLWPVSLIMLIILLLTGKAVVAPIAWPSVRLFTCLLLFLDTVPLLFIAVLGDHLDATLQVARVRSSVEIMASAIRSYQVDHKVYPAWAVGRESTNGGLQPTTPAFSIPTFRTIDPISQQALGQTLTTPISYLSNYENDPYAVGRNRGAFLGYYADDRGFLLFSCGADLDYDLKVSDFSSTSALILKAYDPTNGVLSGGDIFRYESRDGGAILSTKPILH